MTVEEEFKLLDEIMRNLGGSDLLGSILRARFTTLKKSHLGVTTIYV